MHYGNFGLWLSRHMLSVSTLAEQFFAIAFCKIFEAAPLRLKKALCSWILKIDYASQFREAFRLAFF